jgi:hypothetical protein
LVGDLTREDARMAQARRGYVYAIPPIDRFDPLGWRIPDAVGEAWDLVDTALAEIAKHEFWEDRITAGPYVMPLPMPEYHDQPWAVAVKIENNGTVFVWSSVELPHLSEWR